MNKNIQLGQSYIKYYKWIRKQLEFVLLQKMLQYQGSLWDLAVGQTYIRLKFQKAQTGVTFCEYSAYKQKKTGLCWFNFSAHNRKSEVLTQ